MIFLGRNYMTEKTKICCFDVDEDIKEILLEEIDYFYYDDMPEKLVDNISLS